MLTLHREVESEGSTISGYVGNETERHVWWCERWSVNMKVGDKHLQLVFISYSFFTVSSVTARGVILRCCHLLVASYLIRFVLLR